MVDTTLAAVVTDPLKIELQEIRIPEIPPDGALLKVEASSVCGSDWPLFQKKKRGPYIIGHENAGYIAKIGVEAQKKWGIKEGDRVALEEYIPCGVCALCRSGAFRDCKSTDSRSEMSLRYGTTPLSEEPGLWGGYSQYLYVSPRAVIHKIPTHLSPQVSALHLTVANGIQWTHLEGQAAIGQAVVIQGPGRQGLTCAMAAKAAGASLVIITGLSSDRNRLDYALRIGADYAVNVEEQSAQDLVREVTGGEMADLVVDVASGGTDTITTAVSLVRKRGIIVLAAPKLKALTSFNMDEIISKHLTLKGVRGHSFESVEMAIQIMASGRYPLSDMCTHDFSLEQAEDALYTAGRRRNLEAIQSTVLPWGK
jgi:threonine dehydrogenase-like Zn-dependent dehydrogenase